MQERERRFDRRENSRETYSNEKMRRRRKCYPRSISVAHESKERVLLTSTACLTESIMPDVFHRTLRALLIVKTTSGLHVLQFIGDRF